MSNMSHDDSEPGLLGMRGCTPSTASQCIANDGGRGARGRAELLISSRSTMVSRMAKTPLSTGSNTRGSSATKPYTPCGRGRSTDEARSAPHPAAAGTKAYLDVEKAKRVVDIRCTHLATLGVFHELACFLCGGQPQAACQSHARHQQRTGSSTPAHCRHHTVHTHSTITHMTGVCTCTTCRRRSSASSASAAAPASVTRPTPHDCATTCTDSPRKMLIATDGWRVVVTQTSPSTG